MASIAVALATSRAVSITCACLHIGGKGKATIYGGDGADLIQAGSGADLVFGEEGADTLYGNGGRDTIKGGGGLNIIYGGQGNDRLEGGMEHDQVSHTRVLCAFSRSPSLSGRQLKASCKWPDIRQRREGHPC